MIQHSQLKRNTRIIISSFYIILSDKVNVSLPVRLITCTYLGYSLQVHLTFSNVLFSSFIETAPKSDCEDEDEEYLFDVVSDDMVEL